MCDPAHTGSGRRTSDTSYRVAKGASDRSSARIPCPQVLQRHHVVAKGASGRSLARPPCPQVLRRHPGVANGASGRSSARRPWPQVLQRHPGVAKGASGRSLARPPCPQLPQGHPGVAKSHLSKDKPVSARCKDQLSYCRAYRQTYRMVSYVGLTDRQTGLPYRQPYLKLSPAGSHGSSLPAHLTDGFRQPDFSTSRPPDFSERPTDQPYRQPYRQPHRQPHRPATPASQTDQPDQPNRQTRPARPAASPAINTGHPRPAIHPGKGPAGRPYR